MTYPATRSQMFGIARATPRPTPTIDRYTGTALHLGGVSNAILCESYRASSGTAVNETRVPDSLRSLRRSGLRLSPLAKHVDARPALRATVGAGAEVVAAGRAE